MENSNSSKKFEEALHLLNEAAKEKKDEIQNLLTEKYSNIKDVITDAAIKNQERLKNVKKIAEDLIEEGEEKAMDTVSEMEKKIKENPWPYVGGVAIGALLLGFILGSSRD